MIRFVLAGLLAAAPAWGRTLVVGEGSEYPTLAAAVRVVADGDEIALQPGTYYECAIILARDVVIMGVGVGTVLSDKVCEGKALLVAKGDNLTVRDLVLARARSPDDNGAGIRLEGQGLTVERVRFDNNQVGILAGQAGPGRLRVLDGVFEGGGVAGARPTAALMIGGVALLHVERSVFRDVKGGQVASDAGRSELAGNSLSTGVAPEGEAAVRAGGGVLVMRDNIVSVGPNGVPHDAAVRASGTGAVLDGNRLQNETGRPMALLLDWMTADPVLRNNVVGPGDQVVSTSGAWRHRAGGVARSVLEEAKQVGRDARRQVKEWFGR